MATGRNNKLVGQTGEYLVAAELSRQRLIATTFTGNVPHYDIIASDEKGKHVSVQVKAARSKNGKPVSWQFNIEYFCKITQKGKRQIVGKPYHCPVRRLVVVLVKIGDRGAEDKYYICMWNQLRDLLVAAHKDYLGRHGGVRPSNPESKHSAIKEQILKRYQDKWPTVRRNLG